MRKIIEVLGSPDAGKTASLTQLAKKLNEEGIPTVLLLETRGKNLFPKNQRGTLEYNINVGCITCNRIKNMLESIPNDTELVLIDKGLVDYKYFCYYYYLTGKASLHDAFKASVMYDDYGLMPDEVVFMVCDPGVAALRCEDAVATRTVKIQKAIDSLSLFYSKWNKINKYWLDTSLITLEDTVEFLHSII